MSNVEIMKKSIEETIPSNKEELSYIVEITGDRLFGEKWINIKTTIPNLVKPKKSNIGNAIIISISKCFNKKEDIITLINHLFLTSFNVLKNNNFN